MKLLNYPINPIAIALCAVAAFIVGFVWYSFLFKAQWIAGHAFTQEQLDHMGSTAPIIPMALSFIGYLITATALSLILAYCRVTDLKSALLITAIIWVGFPGMMMLTSMLYAGGSLSVFLVDGGYQLVYSLLMATIINRMS